MTNFNPTIFGSGDPAHYTIVFVRHGESDYDAANKFCGWNDSDLSSMGMCDASQAGKMLKEKCFQFDIAFTSVLKRSIKTCSILLEQIDQLWIPVEKSWRLNDRMYGALTGLKKHKIAAEYGEDQTRYWRRHFDGIPPPMNLSNPNHPGNDPRYWSLNQEEIPLTECLADTYTRVMSFWHDEIVPAMKSGERILVVAHGTTIRAIVKHLDQISDQDINKLNIPMCIPLVYYLDDDLKPIKHSYLASELVVSKAIEKIVAQGKSRKKPIDELPYPATAEPNPPLEPVPFPEIKPAGSSNPDE